MEQTIAKAAEKAVEAVRKRDRNYRWALAIGVSVILLAMTIVTTVIVSQQRQIRNIETSITCALAEESQVTQTALIRFAHRFGADLPRPAEIPVACKGTDPIYVGTSGDDVIQGTPAKDWANGEGGDDTVAGRGGGDTLIGGTGSDRVYGGKGTDWEYGGNGNDELHAAGDEAIDHLDGAGGTDTCYVRTNDVYEDCEKVIHVPG